MQTLYFVVVASCLGQPGYPEPRESSPSASQAVYEEPEQGSGSRSADLRWQRRGADSGVRAAAYQEDQAASAPRSEAVLWLSWSIGDAQSDAAFLIANAGKNSEAEELRGVPLSMSDLLERSGGQSDVVMAYWDLVDQVTRLGMRREEFALIQQTTTASPALMENNAWAVANRQAEAEYIEAKRDLGDSRERLRRMLGAREMPLPTDPFWTGAYDTGLASKDPEKIPIELRHASDQIGLQYVVAKNWAEIARIRQELKNPQPDIWAAEFEQWRIARTKALDATADYNRRIARFALMIGKGDSRRLTKMILLRSTNIARAAASELPR
jgi:hypothetical protein